MIPFLRRLFGKRAMRHDVEGVDYELIEPEEFPACWLLINVSYVDYPDIPRDFRLTGVAVYPARRDPRMP